LNSDLEEITNEKFSPYRWKNLKPVKVIFRPGDQVSSRNLILKQA
jgi:hypothetical protein